MKQQRKPFTQQLRELGLNSKQIKSVINHLYYSHNGSSLNTFDILEVRKEDGKSYVYYLDEFRDMGCVNAFALDYFLSK